MVWRDPNPWCLPPLSSYGIWVWGDLQRNSFLPWGRRTEYWQRLDYENVSAPSFLCRSGFSDPFRKSTESESELWLGNSIFLREKVQVSLTNSVSLPISSWSIKIGIKRSPKLLWSGEIGTPDVYHHYWLLE